MSAKSGSSNLGSRLGYWSDKSHTNESHFVSRADLKSDDPYAILGLLAHPGAEQIDCAYSDLKGCYGEEQKEMTRINWAYQELRSRHGVG